MSLIKIDQKFIESMMQKLQGDAERTLLATSKEKLLDQIRILFHDKHRKGYSLQHPDEGMLLKQINSFLTETALDPKWEQYMKDHADKIFQEELDKAMRLAAEHKARKIAFASINEQTPRQGN